MQVIVIDKDLSPKVTASLNTLYRNGCACHRVADETAALDAVAHAPVEAVLMAWTGASTLTHLARLNEADSRPAVIVLAAEADETAFAVFEQGAEEVLEVERLNGPVLWRAVRAAVARRRQRSAAPPPRSCGTTAP